MDLPLIASAGIPKLLAESPGLIAGHLHCSNSLCNVLGFHLWLGEGDKCVWQEWTEMELLHTIMSERPAKYLPHRVALAFESNIR